MRGRCIPQKGEPGQAAGGQEEELLCGPSFCSRVHHGLQAYKRHGDPAEIGAPDRSVRTAAVLSLVWDAGTGSCSPRHVIAATLKLLMAHRPSRTAGGARYATKLTEWRRRLQQQQPVKDTSMTRTTSPQLQGHTHPDQRKLPHTLTTPEDSSMCLSMVHDEWSAVVTTPHECSTAYHTRGTTSQILPSEPLQCAACMLNASQGAPFLGVESTASVSLGRTAYGWVW